MLGFKVGDVVSYVGQGNWSKVHIIKSAEWGGTYIEYSTDKGAWFTDKDFILIRNADKESFKGLRGMSRD